MIAHSHDAGQRPIAFRRIASDGVAAPDARAVAEEAPVAIEVNGMGYAVLMATPAQLDDLACGFLLTERLIERRAQILSIDAFTGDAGVILRVTVEPVVAQRLTRRVRHRTSDGSCGLCGIENLEQAIRPLPPAADRTRASDTAVFRALDHLWGAQPLNRATGAVHAAALCDTDGAIITVREDVGRHNAFDKLIGAMMREGRDWNGGFALLSSRCSFELVEKAVLSGCPMLVTVSAATGLAIDRAAGAGLKLRVLARPDALLAPEPG